MRTKSVVGSTLMIAMKMKAWITTGGVCPIIIVPGISSSGTTFFSLNSEVVGAKEPMPSVSKKFVPKPTRSSNTLGRPRQPSRSRPARVAAAAARAQATSSPAVKSARTENR